MKKLTLIVFLIVSYPLYSESVPPVHSDSHLFWHSACQGELTSRFHDLQTAYDFGESQCKSIIQSTVTNFISFQETSLSSSGDNFEEYAVNYTYYFSDPLSPSPASRIFRLSSEPGAGLICPDTHPIPTYIGSELVSCESIPACGSLPNIQNDLGLSSICINQPDGTSCEYQFNNFDGVYQSFGEQCSCSPLDPDCFQHDDPLLTNDNDGDGNPDPVTDPTNTEDNNPDPDPLPTDDDGDGNNSDELDEARNQLLLEIENNTDELEELARNQIEQDSNLADRELRSNRERNQLLNNLIDAVNGISTGGGTEPGTGGGEADCPDDSQALCEIRDFMIADPDEDPYEEIDSTVLTELSNSPSDLLYDVNIDPGSCPLNPSFQAFGSTVSVDVSIFCNIAVFLKTLVIISAWLTAVRIYGSIS